uniref:Protein root UVB sensitive/RUS domain-containing protein n=1 Tax=Bubo bubo TaxID=30461 RepID=A0A8C0FWH1_BUBBB
MENWGARGSGWGLRGFWRDWGRGKWGLQVSQGVLLPQGYPESISPNYLQYQCWEALQVLLGVLGGAGRGLEDGLGKDWEVAGREVRQVGITGR